jgi:hypothetical protein
MLETAGLLAALWGEVTLTACYLWNHSESSTLSPGVTPYEVLNNCKPNLSHLHIFGARCFAHIPSELQAKLGPHSHHVVFVGYLKGTKGYCSCDEDSGTFFVACDVIFDENFPSLALTESDSDDSGSDGDSAPTIAFSSSPSATAAPPVPAVPAIPPAPSAPPRRSSHQQVCTAAGQAFAEDIAASKACLQALRDAHLEHTTQLREGVTAANPGEEKIRDIEPNVDVPEVLANVCIKEQAHIILCSNCKCNPQSPNYDMYIPPQTYDKAMKHMDHAHWLKAMKAELTTMKDRHGCVLVDKATGGMESYRK